MLNLIIYLIYLNIILNTPLCREEENFCYRCNPQKTLCVKCQSEVLIPDNNGGCTLSKKCKVGKNSCLECSNEDDKCKICDNDYYPDENGGCSYSDNCLVSENGRCLKCKDNYILIGVDNYFTNGIKICKSLDSFDLNNCERIDSESGKCLRCKEGFYLGREDNKCTNIQNCEESIYGQCKKCKLDYYLNIKENKCTEENKLFKNCKISNDGEKCDECDLGYYFDESGKCASINYCSEQTWYGRCKKCINGYYLSENYNSCTSEKYCLSGDKDFGVCNSCNWNYYLDLKDRKCKSNREDNIFKYCREANEKCILCTYGYELGEDKKCSTSYYCQESEDGICKKCKMGYHLGLDNRCNNLEHCERSSFYYDGCYECEKNYFFDRQNETCVLENENFTNCRAGYAEYYCQECRDEYYLNQTDHTCYNNTENPEYYKCAITSSPGEKCLDCVEGYFIGEKDAKCSKIEGCILSKNENWCLECGVNYCLNVKTGQCIFNKDIYNEEEKFFYRCNRTNEEATACEVCSDNYTLDENGLCVDEEHCIERKDGICQDCMKKINNTFCLNEDFGCVRTYDEGCLRCNDILNFYDCTKCYEGYVYDELFHNCKKKEEDENNDYY